MTFFSLAFAFLFASSHVESLKVILDPDDSSYDRAVDTYFKAVGIESEDDEFFSQFGGLLERSQKGLLASRKMKQLKVIYCSLLIFLFLTIVCYRWCHGRLDQTAQYNHWIWLRSILRLRMLVLSRPRAHNYGRRCSWWKPCRRN
jgi:hypothetical protein